MIRRAFPVAGRRRCSRSGVAGCGERPQVIEYKQGKYQGKPDQAAYDTAPWNGNKRDWELALANRNQNQNEYKRIR